MSASCNPDIIQDGLVLHLDAADKKSYPGAGTIWYDRSGFGNNGTLTNGPTFGSSNGGNIVFDGVNDYVEININSIPGGNSPRTLGIWCKVIEVANASYKSIINQGTYAANQQFQIGIINGKFNVNSYNGMTYDTINYITNIWYFLAVTYDGTSYNFYRNGDYIISTSVSLNTLMGKLRIAANPNGAECSNINLSLALIYNRALSAAEILQNYNNLKNRFNLV